MYLLTTFKRKLGSKDKQKRRRIILKTIVGAAGIGAITTGAIIGGNRLVRASGNLAANNNKFKNLFLKKATRNLNNEVREQIKQDRNAIKSAITNHRLNTPQPKSTDVVLSVPDLKQLAEQNKAAENNLISGLKASQKTTRRNIYGNRYSQLNQNKENLARVAGRNIASTGIALGISGLALSGISKARKARKEKKNVSTN